MTTLVESPPDLIDLMATAPRRAELRALSLDWPSVTLDERQIADLELLLNGGFSSLRGFLGRRDLENVCSERRLADGTLWPVPVTLDIAAELASRLTPGQTLALRDLEGSLLAALQVEELFELEPEVEARAVFGTADPHHPGVALLMARRGRILVGGRLEGIERPRFYDFQGLRLDPATLRRRFAELGWQRIVAFQTRNPLHRGHVELTHEAMRRAGANLLIHPVVGPTRPGDIDSYTRVRCYKAVLDRYPPGQALLAVLPLQMRMAGPREALLHAMVRRNYGCTHMIVGRDHAGPGPDRSGKPYYDPYAAQELVARHAEEVGIELVASRELVYVKEKHGYLPDDRVPAGMKVLNLSGSELRERLARGQALPSWFTYPQVARELRLASPPLHRRGFTVFFTGLSGSGKSTLANLLRIRLLECGGRAVTLLDGDLVRRNLSSELGFSKEHRDLNIRRIGFVAEEITKNGGVAICAPIAPYEATRQDVRQAITQVGGFVLVYLETPLVVCETRDRKGLYAKARAGLLPHFTGIDDPYEAPQNAEIALDTSVLEPEAAVEQIIGYLTDVGFLRKQKP